MAVWTALVRTVFEVEPLKCSICDGNMKIVAFIEEGVAIEKILRHCSLWEEEPARPPPEHVLVESTYSEPVYDYSFVEPA